MKIFSLATVTLLAIAGTAFAQGPAARAEIKDAAGLFETSAIRVQEVALQTLAGKYRIPIVIETIEELKGQTIEEATRRHAEQSEGHGIYVLASRRDHKIDVLVSKTLASQIPEPKRAYIQNAFMAGFRQGDFNQGLSEGVGALKVTLDNAKLAANVAEWTGRGAATAEDGPLSLVLRNQVRLTLNGARSIIEGAQKKAVEMNLKVNIAVVDDGGHAIAFERMDGARPASIYTATTKAVTAATFRAPSGPIPPGTTTPDPLLNLSLQNAALASGGKLTTLAGGVPVIVDQQVIGGVGVGGGSSEQDATIARAGIEAFQAALKTPVEPPKPAPAAVEPAEK